MVSQVDSQKAEPRWASRIARSLLGGSIATLAVSAADAWWAAQSMSDDPRAPSFVNVALGNLGVVAPVLLVVSLGFALAALITHPRQAPSISGLIKWLTPERSTDRFDRAVLLPLVVFGSVAWMIGSANVARVLLSTIQSPRASGIAISVAAILIGMCVGALVLAAFAAVRGMLEGHLRALEKWFSPAAMLAGALVVCGILIAYGIVSGSTGGEGGPLGFFGVLKRLELDLRPPALALIVGLSAYASARLLSRLHVSIALVLAIVPAAFTVHVARQLDSEPRLAAAIERDAPLGHLSIRVMRKLTDRDGDGASAYFGGGDCNDRNSSVSPTAAELPGNGVDEDCSGEDLAAVHKPSAAAPSSAKAPEAKKIPSDLNVILITIDTLRADVGFMGYPRETTPSLDKLAARSSIFETVYSLASYTGKSIGPMMLGKYPSETDRGWLHYNKFPEKELMVQERLKEAGILTISVQSHWYFKEYSGLGRGFDVLDMSASPPQGIDATTDTTSSADRLTDSAIKVLSKPENTKGRFFAWVHYFDPHAEYVRHEGTKEFGRTARDMYDHEVRFTDDQMSRLLEHVAKQPWGAKTAIVVTSDHGEAFGEHKMYRHGFELWEPLVRVPLVIYLPNGSPKRIKERRSLVDLVPTILELHGVERAKPRHESDFLSGQSLLADIFSTDAPAERDVFIDMPAGPFNEARRAFIHQGMKLTVAGGVRYQLFDLNSDPEEKTDLSDDKDLLKKHRANYDAFRSGLREVEVKPIKK